jgi:hypothetical protein
MGATANEAYWRSKSKGSISATPNTLENRINNAVAGLFHYFGMDEKKAQRQANKATAALNDLTPVGGAISADNSKREFKAGHYGKAATQGLMAALSVLPDGGAAVAKALGAAGHAAVPALHSIIAPLFHGSPHKFEKFALDKIGTGEGAQAYGHGLYFAEEPAVARQYQNILGFKHTNGAPPVDWGNDPASGAAHWLLMHNGDREAAVRTFESMKPQHQRLLDRAAKGLPVAPGAEANSLNELKNADAAIQHIRNGTEASPPNPGHLYEVKLDANPEDFLNWDAPIGRQPEHIRRGVGQTLDQFSPGLGLDYPSLTGGELRPRNVAESQALLKNGIPGIRYLDQGSRGAGQGTHNYVVFDPSIIDILNRY